MCESCRRAFGSALPVPELRLRSVMTSQSTNSTRILPFSSTMADPTRSPFAPRGAQLAKFGFIAGEPGGAMKAALSIGSKRPELSRSFEMMVAISRPSSVTRPSAPVKSAIAIGVGATMPSVISMRSCAAALSATSSMATSIATRRLAITKWPDWLGTGTEKKAGII